MQCALWHHLVETTHWHILFFFGVFPPPPSAYLLSITHSKNVRFPWVILYIARTKYSLAIFLKDLVSPRNYLLQTVENDGAINLQVQDDGILLTKFMSVELVRNHLRGLTALIVNVFVFRDVTPCILVDNYRRLLGRSQIGRYLRYDYDGMTTEYGAHKLEAIYSDDMH